MLVCTAPCKMRVFPCRIDQIAPGRRTRSPLKRRLELCQACWCECRSIPGACTPIISVITAPQSPPCATKRVYPRRFMRTTQGQARVQATSSSDNLSLITISILNFIICLRFISQSLQTFSGIDG